MLKVTIEGCVMALAAELGSGAAEREDVPTGVGSVTRFASAGAQRGVHQRGILERSVAPGGHAALGKCNRTGWLWGGKDRRLKCCKVCWVSGHVPGVHAHHNTQQQRDGTCDREPGMSPDDRSGTGSQMLHAHVITPISSESSIDDEPQQDQPETYREHGNSHDDGASRRIAGGHSECFKRSVLDQSLIFFRSLFL